MKLKLWLLVFYLGACLTNTSETDFVTNEANPSEICTDESQMANENCSCPAGSVASKDENSDFQTNRCEVTRCGQNEYVLDNQCIECPSGTTHEAGDDASGPNTECTGMLCSADTFVSNHTCRDCRPGTINEAGDDASGRNTYCTTVICSADTYVSNHACVDCRPGATNEAGDDASGPDTSCRNITCAMDEYVSNQECQPCPGGTTNEAGDVEIGGDTSCSAILCRAGYRVFSNQCVPCPSGTTSFSRDDASGPDTTCTPTRCGENRRVFFNTCVDCPSGTYNFPGDDASGPDTQCDQVLSDIVGEFVNMPVASEADLRDGCLNGQHLGHMVEIFEWWGFELQTNRPFFSTFPQTLNIPTDGSSLIFSQSIETRSDQAIAQLGLSGGITTAALFSQDCSVLHHSIPVVPGFTSTLDTSDFTQGGVFTDTSYRLVMQVPYYSRNPFTDLNNYRNIPETDFYVNYHAVLEDGSACQPGQFITESFGGADWDCQNTCCPNTSVCSSLSEGPICGYWQ